MTGKESAAHVAIHFIVAGYRGETPTEQAVDFVTVTATDLQQAISMASERNPGFQAINGLSESELRSFLARIEEHKAAAR